MNSICFPVIQPDPFTDIRQCNSGVFSILRFLPPLVITKEQVDEMADSLGQLIEELA